MLWEHAREGEPMQGFTDNYIRVKQANGVLVEDNTVTTVQLGNLTSDGECLVMVKD